MEEKKIYTQEELSQMSLEERMLMYRSQTDYRLSKNSYVLMMLDGRSFSRKVKKRFTLPFDEGFINAMNATAAYLCSQIQGARFAYVQSDEISIFLTDIDSESTGAFFDYRLSKMNSIAASLASSFFTREIFRLTNDDSNLFEFDCRSWTVPTMNDVMSWFLYRQIDCIRNSKQQAAQTYLPHKALLNKHTDEQVEMLLKVCRIDWNDYDDSKKFGRFIYKEKELHTREFKGEQIEYERSVWKAHPGSELTVAENREWLNERLSKINNK